jgi:hypothetical protein
MAMEHRSLGSARVVRRKMKGGLLVEAKAQELALRPQRPSEVALLGTPAPTTQLEPIQNAVPAKPDDSKRCKWCCFIAYTKYITVCTLPPSSC